jgi:hypothetical protein
MAWFGGFEMVGFEKLDEEVQRVCEMQRVREMAGLLWGAGGERVKVLVRGPRQIIGVQVDGKVVLSYEGDRSTERILAGLKAMLDGYRPSAEPAPK